MTSGGGGFPLTVGQTFTSDIVLSKGHEGGNSAVCFAATWCSSHVFLNKEGTIVSSVNVN